MIAIGEVDKKAKTIIAAGGSVADVNSTAYVPTQPANSLVIIGETPQDNTTNVPEHCICIGHPITKDGTVLQFLVYGGGFSSQWGVSYCIYRSTGSQNYNIISSTPKISLGSFGLHRILVNIPVKAGDFFGFCNINGQCDISTLSKDKLDSFKEYQDAITSSKDTLTSKDTQQNIMKVKDVAQKAVDIFEKGFKSIQTAGGINKVKDAIELTKEVATGVEANKDMILNVEDKIKKLKKKDWSDTTNSGNNCKPGTSVTLGNSKNDNSYSVQIGMVTTELSATYYQTPASTTDSVIDSDVFCVIGDKYVPLFQHTLTCLYITLPNTTDNDNFSNYMIPASKPWGANDSNVYTRFSKIRFDPISLTVNTSDYSYSKSSGNCSHYKDLGITNTFPLGTAFDCEGAGSHTGKANINLLGTPFSLNDAFKYDGVNAAGSFNYSNNNQIVDLTGGGNGGWICPLSCNDEKAAVKGGWILKLKIMN